MSIATDTVQQAALALLARRKLGGSICPSEIARTLAATKDDSGAAEWRDLMPAIHAAVDLLLADGVVDLSWKGTRLSERAGPYRISAGRPR